MKNMNNEELFEAILMVDQELDEAITTGNEEEEKKLQQEQHELMTEMFKRGLEVEFEAYAAE